jgi:uncharacterized protein (DUF1778 family)
MDESPSLTKDAHLVVRLRQKEREEIEEAANARELRLSDYVRVTLLAAARRTLRRRVA